MVYRLNERGQFSLDQSVHFFIFGQLTSKKILKLDISTGKFWCYTQTQVKKDEKNKRK